jgi:hypothetical protein
MADKGLQGRIAVYELDVDGVVRPKTVGLHDFVALNEFAHFLSGQLLAGISSAGS